MCTSCQSGCLHLFQALMLCMSCLSKCVHRNDRNVQFSKLDFPLFLKMIHCSGTRCIICISEMFQTIMCTSCQSRCVHLMFQALMLCMSCLSTCVHRMLETNCVVKQAVVLWSSCQSTCVMLYKLQAKWNVANAHVVRVNQSVYISAVFQLTSVHIVYKLTIKVYAWNFATA